MANGMSKYAGYLAGDDQRYDKTAHEEKYVDDEIGNPKSEERIRRIIGDNDDE